MPGLRTTFRPQTFQLAGDHRLTSGVFFAGLGHSPGGLTLVDSVRGAHATLTNYTHPRDAWVWVDEIRRYAVRYTRASNQYALGPTRPGIIYPCVSVSVWAKTVDAGVSYPCMLGNARGATDRYGFMLYNYGAYVIWETAGSSSYGAFANTTAMTTGTWDHYAAVYNNLEYFIYKNGVLLANNWSSGAPVNPRFLEPLVIGNTGDLGAGTAFDGWIADPIVWLDRALNQADILMLCKREDPMMQGWLLYGPPPGRYRYSQKHNYKSSEDYAVSAAGGSELTAAVETNAENRPAQRR